MTLDGTYKFGPQDLSRNATPTFAGLIIANGGTIGQAAGPLITFDDTNNNLVIAGCTVGIGTTDSDFKLNLSHSNTFMLKGVNTEESGAGAGAGMLWFSDDGAVMGANQRLGFIVFGGAKNSAHLLDNTVAITAFSESAWSLNDNSGSLRLETTPSGSTTRLERMRILGDGGIKIFNLKSGANQGAAGAAADELWMDTADNSIKMGT